MNRRIAGKSIVLGLATAGTAKADVLFARRPDFEVVNGRLTYRGWVIWDWTGWKPRYSVADCDTNHPCVVCGLGFKAGDRVWVQQNVKGIAHAACDDQPDYIVGQWLAYKGPESNRRWAESCAGTLGGPCGGEYKPGVAFDFTGFSPEFTSSTHEEKLVGEQYLALLKLKEIIDGIEDSI